ncbi:MAG: Maf family protein [Alphaproteobacteria bacterium]
MPFVLASASPRRLELLQQIGLTPDEVVPADLDETVEKGELPKDLVLRLSKAKAVHIAQLRPQAVILGADTVVACGRRILGKPADALEAEKFLRLLSGRRHRVYTGVCLALPNQKLVQRAVMSAVIFKHFSEEEIIEYVEGKEWEGKAGGYSIQGIAGRYVRGIIGSYPNVVGLPIHDVWQMLHPHRHFLNAA